MHSVWDGNMFESRVQEYGGNVKYIAYLVKQIGTAWRAEVPEWLTCPVTPVSEAQIKGTDDMVLQDSWYYKGVAVIVKSFEAIWNGVSDWTSSGSDSVSDDVPVSKTNERNLQFC
jgi:hypothetical protein